VDDDVTLAPPDEIEVGASGFVGPTRNCGLEAEDVPITQDDVIRLEESVREQGRRLGDIDIETAGFLEDGLEFRARGLPVVIILAAQD
jgi:hypothetical protein